jgi:hypothetical protein
LKMRLSARSAEARISWSIRCPCGRTTSWQARRLRDVDEHRLVDEVDEDGVRAEEPLQRQVDLAVQRADPEKPLEVLHAEAARPARLLEDVLEVAGLGGAPALLERARGEALGVGVLVEEATRRAGAEGVLGECLADGVAVAVGPCLHAAQQLELGGRHAHVGPAQLEPALVDLVDGGGGEVHAPVIGRSAGVL